MRKINTHSTVIIVVGFPGSGKSTIAKSIAAQFNAAYLDKDSLCNTLTGVILESQGESANIRDNSEFYRLHIMPAEYDTLFYVANSTLFSCPFVVMDAPFVSFFENPSYLNKRRQQLGWHNVNIIVVEVHADRDVTKQRLISRGELRDMWKIENWESYSKLLSSTSCCWDNVEKIRFDNSTTTENSAQLFQQIGSLITR